MYRYVYILVYSIINMCDFIVQFRKFANKLEISFLFLFKFINKTKKSTFCVLKKEIK